MKRGIRISLLVALAVSLWFSWPTMREAWHRHRMERDYRAEINRARREGCDVLFLGDSITDQWRRHPDEWARFPRAANYGYAGDTSSGLLARIGDLKGIRPRRIVLLIGTNDIRAGISRDRTVQNIRAILDRLTALFPDARIVLVGVLSGDSSSLNSSLSALQGVTFIDPKMRPEMFTDGVHLSASGYRALADAIRDAL